MLNLLSKARTNFLILPLMRLAYRLQLGVFKKALRLRTLLIFELENRIRARIEEARLEGHDEQFDRVLHLTVCRMTKPELFETQAYDFLFRGLSDETRHSHDLLRRAYENETENVTALIKQVNSDKGIKKTIERFELLNHFLETKKGNQEAAAHYLLKAKHETPEAKPLSVKDLYALESNTRKITQKLRELISDREAIKISLSLGDVTSSISVISSFFLITGYLYNHFLLGQFGIEVSKYFSLSDYLASSLDGIRYSASGAALGLLSYFIGMHCTSRKSRHQLEYEKSQKQYWPYLIFVSAIVGAAIGYLKNLETFYDASYIVIIFSAMYFIPRFAAKYFKDPLTAMFLLIFIASFSAHMFAAVGKAAFKFKNYEFSKLNPFEVEFNKRISLTDKEFTILAGNSGYLFFLDRQRSAIVVRKEEVLYLRQNRL